MILEIKGVEIPLLKEKLPFNIDAIPGHSLFSLEIKTGELKLESTALYSYEEIQSGLKKKYIFETDNSILFMQAADLRHARRRFEQFLKSKFPKIIINEKITLTVVKSN